MYIPGLALQNQIKELAQMLFSSDEFKRELSNQIRMEIESSKNKQSKDGFTLSYDMLTRGNVNMQARMAASGYDVYGKTIISTNQSSSTNDNYYKKMKNKINYGSNPASGYNNVGSNKKVD